MNGRLQGRRGRRKPWEFLPAIERLEPRLLLTADFGDAPYPYPTLLSAGGAYHLEAGPMLGAVRDVEADGLPGLGAIGDDAAGAGDEDGVTGWTNLRAGAIRAQVTVSVQNAPEGARLDAWLDMNADGCWNGAMERIADALAVSGGDNVLSFQVPAWAAQRTTYARFRLSTAGVESPRGTADDGEVEDYAVTILPPVATVGVFSTRHDTAAGSWISSILPVDLDGDGDTDVITAEDPGGIVWYENDGNQSFTARTIATSRSFRASLGVADIDRDGDLDVVRGTGESGTTWFENDDSGNFTEHEPGTGATSIMLADIDGDGWIDILANSYGFGAVVSFNNHDGTFNELGVAADVAGTRSARAADLDRDGDLDLVLARAWEDSIVWCRNDGDRNFTTQVIGTRDMGFNDFYNGANDAIPMDMEGDGDLDVLGVWNNGDIVWYERDAQGAFIEHFYFYVNNSSVWPSDLDGDGDLDLACTQEPYGFALPMVAWWQNDDGNQNYNWFWLQQSVYSTSGASADMDGDGDLDIVCAARQGLQHFWAWYENDNTVMDFGDAPSPYPTTFAADGARHLTTGPRMGSRRESEPDGQPHYQAEGDDVYDPNDRYVQDDEDGVRDWLGLHVAAENASVVVNVQIAPEGATLDAWIDFDQDGSWDDPGEQIAQSLELVAGDNTIRFSVPDSAETGYAFARFRLSSAGGLSPTGGAPDGEVEDHRILIERKVTSLPDLGLRPTIQDSYEGAPGERIPVAFTVRNHGGGAAGAFDTTLYLSLDEQVDETDTPAGSSATTFLMPDREASGYVLLEAPPEPGTYYLAFHADGTGQANRVIEDDETNNWGRVMMLVVDLPLLADLVILPAEQLSYTVKPGQHVTIPCTVANQGDADANIFRTVLFRSNDATVTEDDVQIARMPGIIEFGSQSASEVSFDAPMQEGTYYLAFEADCPRDAGYVVESDETNNWGQVITLIVRRPLEAELIVLPPSPAILWASPGDALSLPVTVRNVGLAAAGAFQARLYVACDVRMTDAQLVWTFEGGSLADGASASSTAELAAPAVQAAWFYAWEVDGYWGGTTLVNVCGEQIADLTVSAMTVPELAPLGSSQTVRVTVANNGTIKSSPSLLRLWLSPNQWPGPANTVVAEIPVPAITQRKQWTGALSVDLSSVLWATAGVYYWVAAVDPQNAIRELSEVNNQLSQAMAITCQAEITATAVSTIGEWIYGYHLTYIPGRQVLVDLNIRLVGDDPGAALRQQWEQGVEAIWSNQFNVTVGDCEAPVIVDLHWVDQGWDQIVMVHNGTGRPDMLNWYTDRPGGWDNGYQDEIAAHEVGHMLGLCDEYLGGALDPVSELIEPDSIMGQNLSMTWERHFQGIVDWLTGQTGGEVELATSPEYWPAAPPPGPVQMVEAKGLRTPSAYLGADDHFEKSWKFTDASGTPVTIAYSGPGLVRVYLEGSAADHADIQRIEVFGSTLKSSLKITAKGQNISIDEIAVDGDLKSLDASACDLQGNLVATGTIGSIKLRDVTKGQVLIGAPPPPQQKNATVTLSLGRVTDVTLVSRTAIKELSAIDWRDLDEVDDKIDSPSLASLKILGSKKRDTPGLMMANLTLGGGASGALVFGGATIAGDLRGAEWHIDGSAGAIRVAGTVAESRVWTAGSIKEITLGAIQRSDFLAGVNVSGRHATESGDFANLVAKISAINIKGWKVARGETLPRLFIDSNFSAASLGTVKTLNIDCASGTAEAPFGLFALDAAESTNEIKSFSYSEADRSKRVKWSPAAGDFTRDGNLIVDLIALR